MARTFAAASSQYLTATTLPATLPATFSARFKKTAGGAGGRGLITLAKSATFTDYFGLSVNFGGARIAGVWSVGGVDDTVSTLGGVTDSIWQHACAVFTSASDRKVYVNGGGMVQKTTDIGLPAGMDLFRVGEFASGFFDGDIAEVAMWSAALDADEVAALAAGVSPLLVRPDALVDYWVLDGVNSPEPGYCGLSDLTLVNAPTAARHPLVIRPFVPVNTIVAQSAPFTGTPRVYRLTSAGWSTVSFPSTNDQPVTDGCNAYHIRGQSLHGKLHLAWKSLVDRTHVWDGTSLRRSGLAAAATPSAADGGGAGVYAAVKRYYRTRSVKKPSSVVELRSEPSPSVAFTPDAAHANATVTRATAIGESETHWEVEVSLDNEIFYRLDTIAIATATYADTAATTTYSSNPQSDSSGIYDLIPSVQELSTDDDRLMLGGSHMTTADGSAIRWTPVGNDPSPGPDERLNSNTDPRIDLDGLEGGGITTLSRVINGTMYAGKNRHIYRIVRTGELVGAYEGLPVTKARGMLRGSLVECADEHGNPALYCLDPWTGPNRLGSAGLQFSGHDLRVLWRRINRGACVPCHGVYYADKNQLHYWIALDGADFPNTKIVLQLNNIRHSAEETQGARGGWSVVPMPARIAAARCSVMFPTNIMTGVLNQVPFIGKATWVVNGATIRNVVQRCDTGSVDCDSTGDTGSAYTGKIRTRPFMLTNILNQHEIKTAALLGIAGGKVLVTAIRDMGTESLPFSADFTAAGTETHVIAQLDDFSLAELYAIQLQFEDDPDDITQWELYQMVLGEAPGQTG